MRREKQLTIVRERKFCIENLLVRVHFIIEMIRWTGLAPWEFEFPLPGSLISTFRTPNQSLITPLQGYLAHKKTLTPPKTPQGPSAKAYGRVLGGCVFL